MVLYARLRFRALGFVSWVEYTPMAGNKPRETFFVAEREDRGTETTDRSQNDRSGVVVLSRA